MSKFANNKSIGDIMKKQITTKDLQSLNELMTFENWMSVKMISYSKQISNSKLKSHFKEMAKIHAMHHKNLLNYLSSNSD